MKLLLRKESVMIVLAVLLLMVIAFSILYFSKVPALTAQVSDLESSNRNLTAQLEYSMSLYSESQGDLERYQQKVNALSAVVLDLATQLLEGDLPQSEQSDSLFIQTQFSPMPIGKK